ncbi:MAG: glycosyltransferase family 39 protein [Chitinispirillaceae bacterium]|nr:glycosyltransferase family 39 protein [Chitinispirillaceae bacterium]
MNYHNPLQSERTPAPFYKKTWFHYGLLVILGALFFFPALGNVHLFDWDEINFAEASREMIETGNYMRVTINYEPFWEKPPLFFWLQTLSMKALGVSEFSARFVNALFGIVTMLVVFSIGKKLYDYRFGLLWALNFPASFLPHVFFKSGIIDPVFNLFIFLGLTCIAWALLAEKKKQRVIMFALAGAVTGFAVLAKGPVAFLLIALVMSVYWALQRFKLFFTLKDLLSFTASLLFVTFVFYGIETLFHGTWFIKEFIRYQIRLFSTGDAGHGRPFYFHFLVTLFGCFPASFFAIRSFIKRDEPENRQQLFNRLVIILFWVVMILFSIVKTKTVLYASLTWFPVTYLSALHMYGMVTNKFKWNRALQASLVVFSVIIAIAITAFPFVLINKNAIMPFIKDKFAVACLSNPVVWTGWESFVGVFFFGILLCALILIGKKRFVPGFVVLMAASVFCVHSFLVVFTPGIEQYSQGGPIAFYKEHSNEDVYIRSLFKSYADLYYGKKKPGLHPKSYDREWLLRGDIDKPVYFVGRIHQDREYSKPEYKLKRLKTEYGFVYYRRDPEPIEH